VGFVIISSCLYYTTQAKNSKQKDGFTCEGFGYTLSLMGHEYSQKEVQRIFMGRYADLVQHWKRAEGSPDERIEGLAFSILSMLDGCHAGMPAFELLPSPAPSDKACAQDEDENWWPEYPDPEDGVTVHGSDQLHEMFFKYLRE
jgi:hypothetical protein